MLAVYCDIFSNDGDNHMNARVFFSTGRTVKGNGGGMLCIHLFLGPYVFCGQSVYFQFISAILCRGKVRGIELFTFYFLYQLCLIGTEEYSH